MRSKKVVRSFHPLSFFFRPLLKSLFPKAEWDLLFLSLYSSKLLCQIGLILSYLTFSSGPCWIKGIQILSVLFGVEFSSYLLTKKWPETLLHLSTLIGSFYLFLWLPVYGFFLTLFRWFHKERALDPSLQLDSHTIQEILQESDLANYLDANDQWLINSFLLFRHRVAKEIMVPRIDLYSLDERLSIQEAAPLFAQEGYSRIPIYQESVDTIVGVVLYKDLLQYFSSSEKDLSTPLSQIAKPVLYAPENKKIPQLLQDFRNKQSHMAIIVDEYGGTEGIVTIEDILEELVGEIADEYDVDEEHLFFELPTGGWIINPKMTILDIEENLGIQIPDNPAYETLGGYIYHTAGIIPPKGWRLSHDQFELEVVQSNERSLIKIKVTPR